MTTESLDHPLRYMVANELHARPAPILRAPCHAVFVALKKPRDAANRDRAEDRAHLLEFLNRFGAPHPPEDADHYSGPVGRHFLIWENHTEFTTYTVFVDGVAERPFDPAAYEVLPAEWLARAPGKRLTSAFVRVEPVAEGDVEALAERVGTWFSPENLAISRVNDASAVVATDFMVDPSGHIRFAVFVREGTSDRRLGRIVQRLLEIEAYKSMALLALPKARAAADMVNRLDVILAEHVARMNDKATPANETLDALLDIASEIENRVATTAYRFSATKAYAEIVRERIAMLREQSFQGRQTIREFMVRRFEPAMRTCLSSAERLEALALRAKRAGDLLGTRVEVERSEQNQELLATMNRRAELQLRLQHTVEGFSIIALSYYAVNLVSYALYPYAGKALGLDKAHLTAITVLPVVLVVWAVITLTRRRLERGGH